MTSPRKEHTGSATAVRSRSLGQSKLQAFNNRKTRTGNQNFNSQDRASASVNSQGNRASGNKTSKRKGDGGIIEQVEEEDKMSADEDYEEGAVDNRNIVKVKKNLLCKTLLDQTKELCYQHSPVYKDFD